MFPAKTLFRSNLYLVNNRDFSGVYFFGFCDPKPSADTELACLEQYSSGRFRTSSRLLISKQLLIKLKRLAKKLAEAEKAKLFGDFVKMYAYSPLYFRKFFARLQIIQRLPKLKDNFFVSGNIFMV